MRGQGFFVLLGLVVIAILAFPVGTIAAVVIAFNTWRTS